MPKSKPTPATALIALMGEYMLNPFALSKAISLSNSAILQILKGKGKVTVPTALRLAKFFGQTAGYWLDLQRETDLAEAANNKELSAILNGISKAKKPKALPKSKPAAKPVKKADKAKTAAKAPKAKTTRKKEM
jgi:addiction module HigA family antidote